MAEIRRTTITVNGQTYKSVDEMPADVRRQYEQVMSMMADRNNNGIPDIMEGRPPGEATVVHQVTSTTHDFNLGARAGAGGTDVPPQVRSFVASSPSSSSSLPPRTPAREVPDSGGITIHITWPTIAALLVVAGIGLFIWWKMSGRG